MSFILSEDQALKTLLTGITVVDEKNASRAVGVWFSTPDIESRAQSYPYMTIELLDVTQATYRQMVGLFTDNDLQGTVAPINNKTYTYEVPVAMDLVYQITSYARHPRHDRAIMSYLLTRVFLGKRGYLAVPNDLGTETGYRHLLLDEFVKRDTIEDGRRLYRNVFTVTVTSESSLNSSAADLSKVAISVTINTTTTHIPSDKQPI